VLREAVVEAIDGVEMALDSLLGGSGQLCVVERRATQNEVRGYTELPSQLPGSRTGPDMAQEDASAWEGLLGRGSHWNGNSHSPPVAWSIGVVLDKLELELESKYQFVGP
jgi:hypothetical protein